MWPIDQLIDPFYEQVYRWFPDRTFDRVLDRRGRVRDRRRPSRSSTARRSIDAVEIDPTIQEIGVRDHPNRPYDDPRVTRIIDDGRAFLRRSTDEYDLVDLRPPGFADPREHLREPAARVVPVHVGGVRRGARPPVTDDGVFVLYNFYREDWLPQKIGGMLEDELRQPADRPAVRRAPPRRFAAGPADPSLAGGSAARRGGRPDRPRRRPGRGDRRLAVPVPAGSGSSRRTTSRALAIIIAFAVLLVGRAAQRSGTSLRQFSPHFFVLGVAFLLLETKSLATFSLLFGTTWIVNCARVLRRARQRPGWRSPSTSGCGSGTRCSLYAALFGSIALAVVLPPASLLIEPIWLRYVVAAALAFAPIFFANLVFSYSFRDTKAADMAFASNLLGAVVGGAIEYVALDQRLRLAARDRGRALRGRLAAGDAPALARRSGLGRRA